MAANRFCKQVDIKILRARYYRAPTPSTIFIYLRGENQTIVVEDLAVKNMMKNHKLAQAMRNASWSELVRQLEYKCQWYGRLLVKIDRSGG
jgi:IS605 OrfB family transposase